MVDHEIAWRSKRHPNVLSSYLEHRKKETRDFYRALYPQLKRRTMEGQDVAVTTVQMETMKALVANLLVVVLHAADDDNDDVFLYEGSRDYHVGSVRWVYCWRPILMYYVRNYLELHL